MIGNGVSSFQFSESMAWRGPVDADGGHSWISIHSHGTCGVYGFLLDAIVKKWAEETAE